MAIFDDIQYVELRRRRLKAIVDHYGEKWFKGKKVLELGCGFGDMGNSLYELGAKVTVSDGRREHLQIAKSKYPHLECVVCDLNDVFPFDKDYDFILNTGVLYHLKEYKYFLENCFSSCKHMFLEAIVIDSDDTTVAILFKEKGEDQSINEVGCGLSESHVERLIQENGFSFIRHFSPDLNFGIHLFDWKATNSMLRHIYIDNTFYWLRRAWFCSHE